MPSTKPVADQGSRKAPRTHNPAWKDNTRAARQNRRRTALTAAAKAAGWASWSEYETAVINAKVTIQEREEPERKHNARFGSM
jgi:hypothetical protein